MDDTERALAALVAGELSIVLYGLAADPTIGSHHLIPWVAATVVYLRSRPKSLILPG